MKNIKLGETNDAKDFKNKIEDLKQEIQNRYDRCSSSIKNINNISSSVLGALSSTTKLVNIASKSNDEAIESRGIVGMSSKPIMFNEDFNIKNPIGRYGEMLDTTCIAKYDNNGIELGATIEQSALNHGGVQNADCLISQQVGENLIKINTLTEPKNIIDFSANTYWSEEIITENKFLPQKNKDGYEIKDGGAFCEIRVKLESTRRINNLFLKPLSKFPIQLCYIKYTQTDNKHEEKKKLQGSFDIPYKDKPVYLSNDGISFNFETTICKNIFIGFTQPHYEYCTMPIMEFKVNETYIPDEEDIEIKSKTLTGYKYEYGLSMVNAWYKDYSSIGVYETKDISSISTINKLYLEEDSIHPKMYGEDDSVYTDNEYYISTISNPTYKDWKPIFPINLEQVDCERLINLGGICYFRFKADSIIEIKCNGKKMNANEYKVKEDGLSIFGVSIANFNPNLIYTASYVPVKESKIIDFNNEDKKPVNNSEVIYCNESNSYLLKAYPHNPTKNNIEVEVLDTIKNKIYKQRDGKISNTTGTQEFEFNRNKFQYYIDQNRIFFNQNMDSRYIIKISYKTLSSRYKLKIILRRNTNKTREKTQHINKINIITQNI